MQPLFPKQFVNFGRWRNDDLILVFG
jgi:hypothetical protein